MTVTILTGDCREVLATLPESSVHSCVTDPPYGWAFMGKKWDYDVPSADTWREVYRVLKPGAHLLAFFGSRTFHRGVVQIEDAGFEIRDQIMWLYGSGFPKSHDVSKGIDRAAGAEREVTRQGVVKRDGYGDDWDTGSSADRPRCDKPATATARQWEGWGTALKPGFEPLVVAQKPLPDIEIISTIGSKIDFLGGCLWSMLSANVAAKLSVLSPSASVAASAFAQWSADGRFSTQAVSSAQMDMSPSEWAIVSSLSIVSSWRSTLAAALRLGNTSTIATAFDTKMDWRTLNSCLSHLTPNIIIQDQTLPGGLIASANAAIRYFSGSLSRLSATLELSAQETATGNPATFSPDADARPYSRPIVVARKPLSEKTVAANVLQHGTGALNIDGCRIATAVGDYASGGNNDLTGTGWGHKDSTRTEQHAEGRWPANVILSWPEDEYELRSDVTQEQKKSLYGWFHENS